MPQQLINIGTVANDDTGDTLRAGGDKINDNFTELYDRDVTLAAAIAGKANTSHSHAISDTTGLQTALDGKQVAGSYAAALHTHALSNLTQSSATTGQVPKWNGSAWAPADEASGETPATVAAKLALADLSGYATSDPGDGKPWIAESGALVVGPYDPEILRSGDSTSAGVQIYRYEATDAVGPIDWGLYVQHDEHTSTDPTDYDNYVYAWGLNSAGSQFKLESGKPMMQWVVESEFTNNVYANRGTEVHLQFQQPSNTTTRRFWSAFLPHGAVDDLSSVYNAVDEFVWADWAGDTKVQFHLRTENYDWGQGTLRFNKNASAIAVMRNEADDAFLSLPYYKAYDRLQIDGPCHFQATPPDPACGSNAAWYSQVVSSPNNYEVGWAIGMPTVTGTRYPLSAVGNCSAEFSIEIVNQSTSASSYSTFNAVTASNGKAIYRATNQSTGGFDWGYNGALDKFQFSVPGLLGVSGDTYSYWNIDRAAGVPADATFKHFTDVEIADGKNIVLGTGTGTKFGTSDTQKMAFYDADPIVQPASILQEAVVMNNTNGEIGGLSFSSTPTQSELNAFRDQTEILADDVRAMNAHANSIRAALVSLGLIAGTGTPRILDTLTIAPECAHSISRQLRLAYNGNIILIRRSNDDAELGIGFDEFGNLDTAAITAFAGSNSAYVKTVYDQMENGHDVTQATAGNQPRIVNAGTLEAVNSIPVMFANSKKLSATVDNGAGGNRSMSCVINSDASGFQSFLYADDLGLEHNRFGDAKTYIKLGRDTRSEGTSGLPGDGTGYVWTCVQDGTNHKTYKNNSLQLTVAVEGSNVSGNCEYHFGNHAATDVKVSEMILFFDDLTSDDRTALANNQKAYYGL